MSGTTDRPLSQPGPFPAEVDVRRLGNLTLSAWASPPREPEADTWLALVLAALLAGPSEVFLLGHKPERVEKLPLGALPGQLLHLLGALAREPGGAPLHRVPREVARAASVLLTPGDLHVRQRHTGSSTGPGRLESTHLGRVLVRASVAGVVDAVEGVEVQAPLQVTLTCLTNPQAGLRQAEAQWLRSISRWTGEGVALTWRGTALTVLAGPAPLLLLRHRLLAWPRLAVRGT